MFYVITEPFPTLLTCTPGTQSSHSTPSTPLPYTKSWRATRDSQPHDPAFWADCTPWQRIAPAHSKPPAQATPPIPPKARAHSRY